MRSLPQRQRFLFRTVELSRSKTLTSQVIIGEEVSCDEWVLKDALLRRVKVRVPEGAKREAGLQHHYRIVSLVEKYNIPTELILNSDQTPSKYVTVGRTTMAPSGSKRVAKAGNDDKRTITLTLTVTMSGRVLPFQIIYGGKTARSIPKRLYFQKVLVLVQTQVTTATLKKYVST